jgi:hypothetical protein
MAVTVFQPKLPNSPEDLILHRNRFIDATWMTVSRNWSKINCKRISHIAIVCFYKIVTLFHSLLWKISHTSLRRPVNLNYVSVCVAGCRLMSMHQTAAAPHSGQRSSGCGCHWNYGCVTEHWGFSQATDGLNCVTSVRQASHTNDWRLELRHFRTANISLTINEVWLRISVSSYESLNSTSLTFLLSFSGCGDHSVFWVWGIKQPGGEADHAILVPRVWMCGAIPILRDHPF